MYYLKNNITIKKIKSSLKQNLDIIKAGDINPLGRHTPMLASDIVSF